MNYSNVPGNMLDMSFDYPAYVLEKNIGVLVNLNIEVMDSNFLSYVQ